MLALRSTKRSLPLRWVQGLSNRFQSASLQSNQQEQFGALKNETKFVRNERLFTTSRILSTSSNTSSALAQILSDEIQSEEDLQTAKMPEDLTDLLQNDIEPHWRLVDNPDSCNIRLFRKTTGSNGKVIISFHCQDTIPAETSLLDGMLPEDGDHGDEDEDEEDSDPIRFTVTVTRSGQSLLFSCLSEQATVTIESIMTKNGEFTENELSFTDKNLYQGPRFEELEQELQDSFHDYLKEDCGVDENMAAFISMYADYKEQTMYVNWLKNVSSMVK